MHLDLKVGDELSRRDLIRRLVDMQYLRNDDSLPRGSFRVRGDVIDLFPSYMSDTGFRIELFGDEIENLSQINILNNKVTQRLRERFYLPRQALCHAPV